MGARCHVDCLAGCGAANKAANNATGGAVDESSEELIKPGEIGKVIKEIDKKVGANPELLEATFLKDTATFQFRKKDDTAFGYRWFGGKIEDLGDSKTP